MSNSTISGNSTTGNGSDGGGIFSNGSLSVSNSTISGNSTTGEDSFGGGIYSLGSLSVSNSTISGNSTTGEDSFGGGILSISLTDQTATISNSTISGNSTETSGGGIFNFNGLLRLRNSTVTNNTAPAAQGSGVASVGNNATLTEVVSSIIAGNSNSDVDVVDGGTNSFDSEGNNLIGSGDATGDFNQTSDTINVTNPGLESLADNGGPTQTHALLPGSPAIDAGSNPDGLTTDQRGPGFPRVVGGQADIGAFEFVPNPNISISDVTVDEGNAGTTTASFMVTLDDPSNQAVSVDYATEDDSATAPLDYLAENGTLTFDPGETTQTISITINGDLIDEANETFFVNLSGATNATLADTQAVGTITDDDAANAPPVATNDSTTANQNLFKIIPVSTLLANDSDPEGNPLSITAVGNASNGKAVLKNNGTPGNSSDDFVLFIPKFGFSGTASFEYTLSDGSSTDTGLVSIAVGQNINLGNGSDTRTGTPGNDIIDGNSGNDSISGLAGDDLLLGGNGNDSLDGGAGTDVLLGGSGNDRLRGGSGNDLLTGGNGSDLFILAATEGRDTVLDFQNGRDRFGLAGGLTFVQLSKAQSGSNTLIKISATNEVLASLTGVNANLIGAEDFTAV